MRSAHRRSPRSSSSRTAGRTSKRWPAALVLKPRGDGHLLHRAHVRTLTEAQRARRSGQTHLSAPAPSPVEDSGSIPADRVPRPGRRPRGKAATMAALPAGEGTCSHTSPPVATRFRSQPGRNRERQRVSSSEFKMQKGKRSGPGAKGRPSGYTQARLASFCRKSTLWP